MKRTISLGIELAEYANEFTDVFTTLDYVKILRDTYDSHVMNFYNPNEDNLFTVIYNFQRTLLDEVHTLTPCATPLRDMESIAVNYLPSLLKNKGAYKQVIEAVKESCHKSNPLGYLTGNFLDSLKGDPTKISKAAMYYDQHAGNVMTAGQVIKTVYAYGQLTGLVDYYNFKEKLNGHKIENSET